MHRFSGVAAAIALVVLVGCSPTGGGGGSTGRIAGLTENQVCAGPVSVDGCMAPFTPASDGVTISKGTVPLLKVQSAANGVFAVDLPPGLYNFEASTSLAGGGVDCPVVPISVTAGATVAVTLHCTVELP